LELWSGLKIFFGQKFLCWQPTDDKDNEDRKKGEVTDDLRVAFTGSFTALTYATNRPLNPENLH
jgi:hypothetical protein